MSRGDYNLQSDVSWARTLAELGVCFSRWEVERWECRPPSAPYADANARMAPGDAKVTVSWQQADGRQGAMAIAHFPSLRENLRVAYLNIDAMRMIERRGGAHAVASAYLMLETGEVSAERDPYEVLGVRSDSPDTVIEGAFRALSRAAHPDRGGSTEDQEELNVARDRIRQERSA